MRKFVLKDGSAGRVFYGEAEVGVMIDGFDAQTCKMFGVVIEYGGGTWIETFSEAEKDAYIRGIEAALGCTGGRLELPETALPPLNP